VAGWAGKLAQDTEVKKRIPGEFLFHEIGRRVSAL